jgi:antitoxin (DNA-binding transcriptional repressor) of toxin-antitoxin stability system
MREHHKVFVPPARPRIRELWHNVTTIAVFGNRRRRGMKDVGVREFRDHASRYLSGDEPLAVRRHGRVVGFYVPVKQKSDTEELRDALREAKEGLAELRRATDLSEEELVEELVPDAPREQGQGRGRREGG